MGHPVEEKIYYTVEEYFQQEEDSVFRSEFYKGELFPMAATSVRHNEIVNNINAALRSHFRPQGCKVLTESVKIEALKNVYYPYPDVILTCDPSDTHNQVIKKPILIVEVASPSTDDYDKGFKWRHYRHIPSLKYYVMVSQSQALVEVFARSGSSDIWSFQEYTDLTATISFPNLDFELPLSVIYELIEFDLPTP